MLYMSFFINTKAQLAQFEAAPIRHGNLKFLTFMLFFPVIFSRIFNHYTKPD